MITFRRAEALHQINEHRVAVGRRRIPRTASVAALARHMALIEKYAPHGCDPWDVYDDPEFDAHYDATQIERLAYGRPR